MDKCKLKAKMLEKNVSIKDICSLINLSKSSFYRKINSDKFSIEQAIIIKEKLNLSGKEATSIFFNK